MAPGHDLHLETSMNHPKQYHQCLSNSLVGDLRSLGPLRLVSALHKVHLALVEFDQRWPSASGARLIDIKSARISSIVDLRKKILRCPFKIDRRQQLADSANGNHRLCTTRLGIWLGSSKLLPHALPNIQPGCEAAQI